MALAAALMTLDESSYAFHGRLIVKELEPAPRNHSALIWHLVQVIAKRDRANLKDQIRVALFGLSMTHSRSNKTPRRALEHADGS